MINGIHALIYSSDVEKTRAFFLDVLKLGHVDAGHGWLIFALPPAELGIHPAEGDGDAGEGAAGHCSLYLMCENIQQTVEDLKRKGVEFSGPVQDQGWGLVTSLKLPGGGDLGIYQPRHPTALHLNK
jgi:hypothetical protein